MDNYVDFGEAIRALKEGKRVRYKHWDEDTFVFMQVPAVIGYGKIAGMQSLPQSVKDEFKRRFLDSEEKDKTFDLIRYSGQVAMVLPDNRIKGYGFSPTKVLSESWIILD